MLFDIVDEKQAMDVLKYIVEKDYDCNTAESPWVVTAKQDIVNTLNNMIDMNDEGEDGDMDIYYLYAKKNKERIEKYIINKVIECVGCYEMEEYFERLEDDIRYIIRKYAKEYTSK